MKFIFIVGLPGSGKTHLGRQMSDQLNGIFLDDICQTCGKGRLKEAFSHQTVIVADPSLCRPINRIFAEAMVKEHHPGCEVEWLYFTNDPDQCWLNIQGRDERLISKRSIYDRSKVYKIPENAKIVSVWKGDKYVDAVG